MINGGDLTPLLNFRESLTNNRQTRAV